MAENFGGYLERVRRFLHEIDSDTSFYGQELLKDLFNDAYRRRCAELTMAFEGFFVDIAVRDLVAEQERYAWPPGFERLQKLELVKESGRTVPVQRFERHIHSNYTDGSTTGNFETYSPTYRPVGSGFVLEPTPPESKTDGLRMEYVGLPAMLEDDGDVLHADFPKSFASLLVYDTVLSALDTAGNLENGVVRTVLRLRGEYEVIWERYIDNRMVSPNQVTPFVGHYGDA